MATHHVIIGGGPAAINAIEAIRNFDGDSTVTLVCDEPAHARMALPYWLAGQVPREHTMIADDAYYASLKVDARIGVRVTAIDSSANKVTLEDGNEVAYDNLLLATGSSPIGLPIPGADLPGVQTLWTLGDTQSALEVAGSGTPRVVMIGSGFIGFIMLNAMYKQGWNLSVVERESHVLPRMLDADGAAMAQDWLATKGASLHCGTTVKEIREQGGAKVVELANGTTIEADLVIVATGVQPNVELATQAGIDVSEGVNGGIAVNAQMQTSVANIFAAGDVALGPVYFSDAAEVHAIQPTAVDHGRVAGANMAGQSISYDGSLLMNVLDICGLQCMSYGNWLDDTAETMIMQNSASHIYRKLMWTGDELTGAMFVGSANDVGMLTDIGMVKGIMQTHTKLGPWKNYLADNPFDIRRAYVALGVAAKLAGSTLLGRPARTRQYRIGGTAIGPQAGPAHSSFVANG